MCDDHLTVNVLVTAEGFEDHTVIIGLTPSDCPELALPAPERAGTPHPSHSHTEEVT